MKQRLKNIGTWAVLIVLAAGAFSAGSYLRVISEKAVQNDHAQTTAMLKLTPEMPPVVIEQSNSNDNKDRELVGSVLKLLKTHFVEPITREKESSMGRGAVRGMLESLDDPDSRYLEPAERKILDDIGNGKFQGIGTVLALRETKSDDLDVTNLIVVTAMPGSPAEKAGILPGDSITHVNDQWVITYDPFKEAQLEELARAVRNKELDLQTYRKTYEAAFKRLQDGMSIKDAIKTLTTKSSGEVSLMLVRAGKEEPLKFSMTNASTVVSPVSYDLLKDDIAYIRIAQFNARSVKDLTSELNRAQASNARGLVLDLRGNPGGTMETATDIAGKIGGGGAMARILQKGGERTIRTPRTPGIKIPVVVLVNAGTASVAELVAGTLRDNAGIPLVGDRTFGDGLIQTPLMLSDGSAAVITTGKMLTPKGFDFNEKGLTPDKVVARGEGSEDAQLDEALKLLFSRIGGRA